MMNLVFHHYQILHWRGSFSRTYNSAAGDSWIWQDPIMYRWCAIFIMQSSNLPKSNQIKPNLASFSIQGGVCYMNHFSTFSLSMFSQIHYHCPWLALKWGTWMGGCYNYNCMCRVCVYIQIVYMCTYKKTGTYYWPDCFDGINSEVYKIPPD